MRTWHFLALAAVLAIASTALAQQKSGGDRQATLGTTVSFLNGKGQQVGTAKLTQTPNGVLIRLEVRGLRPGQHALHFHETGSCDPSTKFKSAGGHFAPRGQKHGYRAEGGPHAGDMPNQYVGKGGVLKAEVLNSSVTLAQRWASLFDSDGSALIVHAGADDYRSQPSGDAGGRVACAVIER